MDRKARRRIKRHIETGKKVARVHSLGDNLYKYIFSHTFLWKPEVAKIYEYRKGKLYAK